MRERRERTGRKGSKMKEGMSFCSMKHKRTFLSILSCHSLFFLLHFSSHPSLFTDSSWEGIFFTSCHQNLTLVTSLTSSGSLCIFLASRLFPQLHPYPLLTHTYFRSSQTQDGCNFWKKHIHTLFIILVFIQDSKSAIVFHKKTQETLTLRIIMHYFTGTTFTSFLLSTFYRLHPRSDWLSLLLNQLHIHWRHTMRR